MSQIVIKNRIAVVIMMPPVVITQMLLLFGVSLKWFTILEVLS